MKNFAIAVCLVCLSGVSNAALTVNLQIGVAKDMSGVGVADGRLWALVADTNNDGIFGGFNINQTLTSSVAADTHFNVNQNLDIGSLINSDTVVAMGRFTGGGIGQAGLQISTIAGIPYNVSGVLSGYRYAFYWFPEATYTGSGNLTVTSYGGNQIGGQVGGMNTTTGDGTAGTGGMTFLGDGSTNSPASGLSTSDSIAGGSNPTGYLQAVAIPEPSTFLLSSLGVLALLRRRR